MVLNGKGGAGQELRRPGPRRSAGSSAGVKRKSASVAAKTMAATEDNGNVLPNAGVGQQLIKPNSSSNEDLSEYTDADESISAPTEFLAEFLSAVMLKDYETALKYCKLILQYEPNNATAQEFYPLILEKLQRMNAESGSSNENESEEDEASEGSSGTGSENTSSSGEDSSEGQDEEEEEEEEEVEVGQSGGDKQSKGSSDGTTGSYSSLEDDEAVDQLVALARKYQIDNVNLGNGNKIYNTAHIAPQSAISHLQQSNKAYARMVPMVPPMETNSNIHPCTTGNLPFGTSSDSESPTEPVSQQTIKVLRARVVPGLTD